MNFLFLDTETTGLSAPPGDESDDIVEIGLVMYDTDSKRITDVYSGLQETQIVMSDEVIAIHGLTNAMLKGRSFDMRAIEKLFGRANGFDFSVG